MWSPDCGGKHRISLFGIADGREQVRESQCGCFGDIAEMDGNLQLLNGAEPFALAPISLRERLMGGKVVRVGAHVCDLRGEGRLRWGRRGRVRAASQPSSQDHRDNTVRK